MFPIFILGEIPHPVDPRWLEVSVHTLRARLMLVITIQLCGLRMKFFLRFGADSTTGAANQSRVSWRGRPK